MSKQGRLESDCDPNTVTIIRKHQAPIKVLKSSGAVNAAQRRGDERINEKVEIIREYENGKAVPNQVILAKMERALCVKLRGKDMGQPLVPKAAKK